MKGRYHLIIGNKRLTYDLYLERSITIIKGMSATGKSTLVSLFEQVFQKKRTGLHCNLKDKLMLLEGSTDWLSLLANEKNKIFIADEDIEYVQTKDFARVVQASDNYFIFITRSGRMKWLTYSVDCIYELGTDKCSDNSFITRLYKKYLDNPKNIKPSLVITEDSNSGYEMIKSLVDCEVVSAKGRDNVYNVVSKNLDNYNCIYAIVDGAAFGSCIGRIYPKFANKEVYLFTPESFEFLLLLSGTFKRYLGAELERTYDFCDSKEYLSWERYYTSLLDFVCKRYYDFNYSKSKLDDFFKSDYFKEHLKGQIKDIF